MDIRRYINYIIIIIIIIIAKHKSSVSETKFESVKVSLKANLTFI